MSKIFFLVSKRNVGMMLTLVSKRNVGMMLTLLSMLMLSSQAFAYCSSKGGNTSYEWIDSVDIGSFSHWSGTDGGYADNTSQLVDLAPGNVAISLNPGFRSSSYTEHWRVWIDFNQDEIFQTSELVYSGSSRSALHGSIVIQNMLGQTVLFEKLLEGKNNISTKNISEGTYIVSIQTENDKFVEKIIKSTK